MRNLSDEIAQMCFHLLLARSRLCYSFCNDDRIRFAKFPKGIAHAELIGEGGVKLVRQIGVEIADASRTDFYVVGKIGPSAQINHDFGQGLVQRAACLTEAANPMMISLKPPRPVGFELKISIRQPRDSA